MIISRFARNTVDFLRIIRELKEHHVRIFFEKENIDTMDNSGELLITILSSQAQEESRNLSENTRWGIVRKFEQGIIQINHAKFLGYTKDSEGRLVIVPEEAEIVIKIYDLYLQGFGLHVESAFKQMKDTDFLTVRPIFQWTDEKIAVHIFVCVLAYRLCCLMRKELNDAGINSSINQFLQSMGEVQITTFYGDVSKPKKLEAFRKETDLRSVLKSCTIYRRNTTVR